MRQLLLLLRFLCVISSLTLSASAATYTVTDLGVSYRDPIAFANALNDNGQIVGYGSFSPGFEAVIREKDGQIERLGLLAGQGSSFAAAVNGQEQVVGYSTYYNMATNAQFSHAFIWSPDHGLQDIGTLPTMPYSIAKDINDVGYVVGSSGFGGAGTGGKAFVWSNENGMHALASLPDGPTSIAFSINEKGQIVGSSVSLGGTPSAVLWDGGGIHKLGTLLGGAFSEATGINDFGQVIGNSANTSGFERGFLWTSDGGTTDLGTLAGSRLTIATDINNLGQVVGASGNYLPGDATNEGRAFLWTKTDGMQDLNSLLAPPSSGWLVKHAASINELGQIVGSALAPDGVPHAVLLTPTNLPEANSLLLGLVSVGLYLAYSKLNFSSSEDT